MYSNPYQWRRIRKRVMVSGESKQCVAASEGISLAALRKMSAFETPPGYCSRNPTMPDTGDNYLDARRDPKMRC